MSEFTPAISADDLDIDHCRSYSSATDNAGQPAPRAALEALLGLRSDEAGKWQTEPGPGIVRHFVVAFKHPVELGTICTVYSGKSSVFWFGAALDRTVSILKADAAYPGDVTKEAQWIKLPDGCVKTLPPKTRTRQVCFTERYPSAIATPSGDYKTPASAMGAAVLFKERYFQATAVGAEKVEWRGQVASNVTTFWANTQTISGFVVLTSRSWGAGAKFLDPKCEVHPTVAGTADWKEATRSQAATYPQAFVFAQPVQTRAVRVAPSKPVGSIEYALGGSVVVLARLAGDQEAPELRIPPAPFSFGLDMPYAGSIGLKITDKNGKLVRRLLGEAARPQGTLREPWDLVDGAGQFVAPGEYSWTALAVPHLELTYETTVNHAGKPPWWAPVRGGGGWMADESPPECVAAVGDSAVLLGSVVCEKGQVGIAVDLDGNKIWGENVVLTGWGGAYRMASDGKCGYIINAFGIQRVDPGQPDFAPTQVHQFKFTPEAPGGAWGGADLGGAVARGDKLYIAHSAPPTPWIAPGVSSAEIDVKRCWPPVIQRTAMTEAEYDGMQKFFSTFLLDKPHDVPQSGFGAEGNATGKLQELVIAFKKPTVVGTVLVPDAAMRVYALKPGKHVGDIQKGAPRLGADAKPDKAGDGPWEPLGAQDAGDGGDSMDEVLSDIVAYKPSGRPGLTTSKPRGVATEALRIVAPRLDYCLMMSHRMQDVAGQARRVYGEGGATANKGWKVERAETPLFSPENPARMALVWNKDVALRGVTLQWPSTASMSFDRWIGPAGDDPAARLADDACWEQKAGIEVQVDSYWPRAAGVRTVDFGGEIHTRALRVRAVLAAGVLGPQGFKTPVKDKQVAGFDSIIAYSAGGNDAPELPPSYHERITEYQLPRAGEAAAGGGVSPDQVKILRHIPLAKPGYLAFSKEGELLAVSEGRVVTVPLEGKGEAREVISSKLLEKPAGLAVDADGLLYVVDQGPSLVKVFDAKKGALVRTIGTPGGMQLGPWDPTRFDTPKGIAIDGKGKLWVVESSVQPKRVSRWSRDGVLEKSFFGPTNYGGGGFLGGGAWMDQNDKKVVNFDGMKFVIDWKDGSSKLESILYRRGVNSPERSPAPNRVIYYKGRRYLVGDPRVYHEVGVICEERNGIAVPLAAAGNLGFWKNLTKYPEFKDALPSGSLERYGFVWTDLNNDAIPQRAEVQWTTDFQLGPSYCAACIGDDLSFNFSGARLRPTGFTDRGAPRYDISKAQSVPLLAGCSSWTNADGSTFVVGGNWLLNPAGEKLWDIIDAHPGVNRSGAPREAGVPVAQFEAMGHLTFGKEDLFVTNGNYGDWFVTSADGLMPTWIMGGPPGFGLRHWTVPEWDFDKTRLDDLRMDAEDFFGSISKADDGKVYFVAGGQQNSVVRVDGLEKMVRLNGTLTVTPDDLAATRKWQAQVATLKRSVEIPKIVRVNLALRYNVAVDGSLDEWVIVPFMPIHEREVEGKGRVVDEAAALAFDNQNLYVAARGTGPMLNSAADSRTLFQGGDAVDVCLGFDSRAKPDRTQPGEGDMRLVFARKKGGRPMVAMFRAATLDTPDERKSRYFSTAGGETILDMVASVPGASVVIKDVPGGWALEASIPWKSLGVACPDNNAHLRGDVGVLHGDQNSLRTVLRLYWAGKTQTCVSDAPTEARLTPALWGDLMVDEDFKAQALIAPPGSPDSAPPAGGDLGP